MTTPKPRVRISREEALEWLGYLLNEGAVWMPVRQYQALRMAIRALKREQKAAQAKKRSKR